MSHVLKLMLPGITSLSACVVCPFRSSLGWNLKPNWPQRANRDQRNSTPLQIGRWAAARLIDLWISAPTPRWGGDLESFYRGLNRVWSLTQSGWSQWHVTLSRMCPSSASWVGEIYIPRTEDGVRSLTLQGSSCGVHQQSRPPGDLLHDTFPVYFSFTNEYLSNQGSPKRSTFKTSGGSLSFLQG